MVNVEWDCEEVHDSCCIRIIECIHVHKALDSAFNRVSFKEIVANRCDIGSSISTGNNSTSYIIPIS